MSDGKRIGDYILEERVCTNEVLTKALATQAALKEESIYKSLGSILIEDFNITQEGLQLCFNKMHLDILKASTTFRNFQEELLSQIVSKVAQKVVWKNSLIFERGSKSGSFFVIISGEVKIFVETEEGEEHVLSLLKPGDSFGKGSVFSPLTAGPSAPFRSVDPSSLAFGGATFSEENVFDIRQGDL